MNALAPCRGVTIDISAEYKLKTRENVPNGEANAVPAVFGFGPVRPAVDEFPDFFSKKKNHGGRCATDC